MLDRQFQANVYKTHRGVFTFDPAFDGIIGSFVYLFLAAVYQCFVQALYNVLYIQALAATSCRFSSQERQAWKCGNPEVNKIGM